jgi:hypothetical protein
MNKRLLTTILAFLVIGFGSWIAIRFAKGYRPNFRELKISATGLLVANSFPNGASVYLNDKLTTATDNTLHLPPGDYLVKIIKDGYSPWEKQLVLKEELVTQTNAELFKSAPDLQSLTMTGAINPLPSPDGLKMAYSIASSSSKNKNGLWILSMQQRSIPFSANLKQIAVNTADYNFAQAGLLWTPDSRQILVVFPKFNLLLDTERLNSIDDLKDVTAQLPLLIKDWQTQIDQNRQEQLSKLPKEMQDIASSSAKLIYFSPDEEKMLYTATASATLREGLIPALPSRDNQPEERLLQPNRVYVYDLKEDRNFFIKELAEEKKAEPTGKKQATVTPAPIATPKGDVVRHLPPELLAIQQQYSPLYFENILWYPTSRHLITIEGNRILVMEYDHTNNIMVYNGPFVKDFVYPWPDGSKLLVLTNLNQEFSQQTNLYTVGIK